MANMRHFLNEMGGDFAFISNQFKLKVGSENFYIDILLFHRKLKALVALETLELPQAFREYLPSPEVITGSVANILDVLIK